VKRPTPALTLCFHTSGSALGAEELHFLLLEARTMYITNWEEFQAAAEKLYNQDPKKVEFSGEWIMYHVFFRG
jgi:hypothetical protein